MIGLSAGPAYTLSTTESAYALPSMAALTITVITSSGVISVSNDNSNWQTITLDSNKNFNTSAQFIRSTTGDSVISIGRNG